MSSRNPSTEILVHITAPSNAADDINYRALATAYLSFEPASWAAVGSLTYSAGQEKHTASPSSTDPSPALLPVIRPGVDSFVSPQLSFGSVAHNLNSPGLRRCSAGNGGDSVESQSWWRPPPSIIEDSNPDNNISIARYSSPTRILEHYLQGFDSSQSNATQSVRPDPLSSPTNPPVTTALPHPVAGRACALPAHPSHTLDPSLAVVPQTPTPSVLKRSRPLDLSKAASEVAVIPSSAPSERTAHESPAREVTRSALEGVIPLAGTDIIIASSLPSSTADLGRSSRADSEPPPPTKRQKRVFTGLSTNALGRSSSDIGPRQDRVKRTQLDRRQRAHQTLDGLEIHSPTPPVSCEDLDVAHVVTKSLEKLAHDLDIKRRFQPKHQARELRTFERGHWAVDCSAWSDSVKQDTWAFLTNYIGNGVGGWGIWCRRDAGFTWIRLYCWGCVVGHMHLLLYIASKRQLNYNATTWVGGDGEVIIRMDPKYTH